MWTQALRPSEQASQTAHAWDQWVFQPGLLLFGAEADIGSSNVIKCIGQYYECVRQEARVTGHERQAEPEFCPENPQRTFRDALFLFLFGRDDRYSCAG